MSDTRCATRYPVLMIHGAGFRDLRRPVYWGRIPRVLTEHGAKLYYGQQDCWAGTAVNAAALRERAEEILRETGAEKLNLLAHSKGGLEARMLASSLGFGNRIASITTIATPHRGSKTVDRLFAMPRGLFNLAAFAVDNWIRLVGDRKPDFLEVCKGFTTEHMADFNRENPDVPGIFYQSFACVMAHPLADINLSTANFVVGRIEGENDGLVSVASARWGERCTVLRSNGFRGISHLDAIDLRRSPLSGRKGPGVSDISEVYVGILEDLKERGF